MEIQEKMPLTLMYITNNTEVGKIAEEAGVDRIFIDLETLGKEERQPNMDTVKSTHQIEDVGKMKNSLQKAELLVRVNKMNPNSPKEIEKVIDQGADIVMLPYFKTLEEIKTFLQIAAGRVKTNLLVETPEAVEKLDDILAVPGIDEIHIGLNDLHLGYHRKFMFELLADGTVEEICVKIKRKGIKYGFGGIASIGKGLLPAEHIIKEHYRLGSELVILSRSFCNASLISDLDEIREVFTNGVRELRMYEQEVQKAWEYFGENQKEIVRIVKEIIGDKE